MSDLFHLPPKQGLYDPEFEKDACGVGFIAQIKGIPSHQIVLDADTILQNMDHRGACGCETNTGDGSGILCGMPHGFMRKVAKRDLGVELPEPGKYSAGLVFFPKDEAQREHCRALINRLVAESGQKLLGWRDVVQETDHADVGPSARRSEPWVEMLFVGAAEGIDEAAFERKLYVIKKQASHLIRGDKSLSQALIFYMCSLSTRVIIYKGMLTPAQVLPYYPDLRDEDFETHLAMVHSRFSTNTFPSWDRAQPLRFMSHNGEINTLRATRTGCVLVKGRPRAICLVRNCRSCSRLRKRTLQRLSSFDNVLEFLLMGGRTLQEAIMMMVPEAWQMHETMPEEKRAFYEFFSCLMEPWDGPASIVFTDGRYIGATLDRNGLRPSRYYLTHDDRVIMASEVGVLPVDPAIVREKGRLQPGRMFLIDFQQGRLIPDEELKMSFAKQRPYAQWLRDQRIRCRPAPRSRTTWFQFGYVAASHASVWLHRRNDELHASADDRRKP